MPLPATFLATCRSTIAASSEAAAFVAAGNSVLAARPAERLAAWTAAFADGSTGTLAALRQFIRATIAALALGDGSVTAADRESAYRELSALYPRPRRPATAAEEQAALAELQARDR